MFQFTADVLKRYNEMYIEAGHGQFNVNIL